MNKFLSKSITVVMAMLLVFSICIQVKATNNYQDTYYTAVFDEVVGIAEDYTPGRYKADTSKGYVKSMSSSYSCTTGFKLVASDGDGSRNYYENFTLYTYYLNVGEYAYLTNLVKEYGYNYAAVKAEAGSSYPYEVHFAWSPDNYRGY